MKSKLQGLIPNILAITFICFLLVYSGYLLVLSNGADDVIKGVLTLSYAIWIFAEMGTTSKEMSEGNTEKDGKSLEFYALSRGVTITITLLLCPVIDYMSPQTYIGGLIYLGSIFFRFYAIRTLGDFYSHRVREKKDHQIINTGPYRYVRHPAYTGMVLANLGFVLIFFSVPAILSYFLLFISAIIYRIRTEEKMLFKMDNYLNVMGDKKRLLPLIW